jgi:hypothetical protein
MHPQSMFSVRNWKLPEILLLAGACFALAGIGFFAAVFLQLHSSPNNSAGNTSPGVQKELSGLSTEQKQKILQQAASTSPTQTSTPTGLSTEEKLKMLQAASQ